MVQALSPRALEDALAEGKHLPEGVIEAVNDLLLKSGSKNYISLTATAVREAICERMGVTAQTLNKNKHWLEFEPFYRAAGWKVVYDRPGYCESYEASYNFSRLPS